jgi:hypothetical protein
MSISLETTGHSEGGGAGSRILRAVLCTLPLLAIFLFDNKEVIPPAAIRLKKVSVLLMGIYAFSTGERTELELGDPMLAY